jgi:homoserine O-succinyltransferase
MPLVANSNLPTFARLHLDGQEILTVDRALHQDIRELHVGLLNMMPDAALQATERQFMRLLGSCNRIVQFYVHPFTISGVERQGAARTHVEAYYEDFARLREEGLDALIITGANVTEPDITREPFWEPLVEVMDWAREQVCSTYMSCLASHAAFKRYHGIVRTHLPRKLWGVYVHRVVDAAHPLVSNVNTRFETPHSRFNDVPREQIERAGMRVLVDSDEAGVLAAVSPDGFRFLYFQGHPEYDANSLLKEYKREVGRVIHGERVDYPPYPQHYFVGGAERVLDAYREQVSGAQAAGKGAPRFPEEAIVPHLENTWTDTGKAIFNNWLGLVYQLTHVERKKPFMPEVDPRDPLGLNKRSARRAAPQRQAV